ncbi:hypothetical protein FNYG_02626 [Fusarium nygamai]|uniref:SMB domain-containing protein n=1 Tax=Gibberella nygamai TaxID=42673 RepID=A0A2K0WNU6_GIBNY|nr:hypothetical protein FNYG_02626 [Fusarium nygamai]
MRYSLGFSGLLTVALSSTGLAQTTTPGPSTTDFSTSGGMNVPTSVTSQLPITFTTTMTTMARPTKSPVPGKCECGTGTCFTPEICSIECTTVYEDCCSIGGSDVQVCKNQYTICLGYNPYDSVFVKPTSCKHDKSYYIEYESKYTSSYFEEKYSSYYSSSSYSTSSYHSGYHAGYYTAEYCCLECTTIYDECCAVPGADIAICKEKYTVCLGYNPFIVVPWEVPSVCKHEESYYKEYESKHGESYYNSKYDKTYEHSEVEVDVEQCCIECTTIYDECCKIPGSVIEVCKKEYTICLGYNPFIVVPWEKPTVCKNGDSGKTDYGHKDVEVTVEECCVQCTTVYDECCAVPGADIAICKEKYTVCLGYNPWDVTPFVKPTVCKHGEGSGSKGNNNGGSSSSSSSSSSHEEECCVQCTTVYDECCSIDGHDIEVCKKEYVVCLGYNPWDVTPFVKPTVCKHGEDSGSKGGNNGGSSSSSSKSDDSSKTSGSKSDSSSKSGGSDEECAVECTTVYKACCDASGAIIETCKTAYTTCLGFNPWDVTPYVEPTVCKKGGKPSGDDVVIVSSGERVRPVLALLAMGAIALL